MSKTSELGAEGEGIACAYLEENGYRVISKNFRNKIGEIDVIARKKDGLLVFVEVKTLKYLGETGLNPEDNFSGAKLDKFKKICELFVGEKEKMIREDRGWQMDLITIQKFEEEDAQLTNYKKIYVIKHYENVIG